MKRIVLTGTSGIIVLVIFLSAAQLGYDDDEKEVQEIFATSCHDCHSDDSKNDDARSTLDFDQWDGYKVTKKISLLIHREAALTDRQKQALCTWTGTEAVNILQAE